MEPQPPPTTDNPDETALLTPAEFRALAARIQRNSNYGGGLFCGAGYSVLLGITVGAIASIWVGLLIPVVCAVVYGLVLALTLWLFTAYARKDVRHIESLLRFITHTQEAAMLGPILDLKYADMHPGDIYKTINEAIDAAVLRLLPLVRATDADTLNTEQRANIGYYIWKGETPGSTRGLDNLPYARGVLHALEQIGDKRDLPKIESLLGAANVTEEFHAAAQRCFDVVTERVTREKDKDVLLRADRKPEAVATLLRPSVENADTIPEQLLRSAAPDSPAPPA